MTAWLVVDWNFFAGKPVRLPDEGDVLFKKRVRRFMRNPMTLETVFSTFAENGIEFSLSPAWWYAMLSAKDLVQALLPQQRPKRATRPSKELIVLSPTMALAPVENYTIGPDNWLRPLVLSERFPEIMHLCPRWGDNDLPSYGKSHLGYLAHRKIRAYLTSDDEASPYWGNRLRRIKFIEKIFLWHTPGSSRFSPGVEFEKFNAFREALQESVETYITPPHRKTRSA